MANTKSTGGGKSSSGGSGSASGSGSATSSFEADLRQDGEAVEQEAMKVGDEVEGEVKKLVPANPNDTSQQGIGIVQPPATIDKTAPGQKSALAGDVSAPEDAVVKLKAHVGELHKLVNNVGHYADMPVVAAEHILADIKYLLSYLHSKI